MHSCTIVVHATCYHPLWPLCNLHWEDLQGALGRVSDNVHLAILRKPFHSSASARAFSGVTGMGGKASYSAQLTKKSFFLCRWHRSWRSWRQRLAMFRLLSVHLSLLYKVISLSLPLIEISISNNKKLLKAGLIIETWPKRVTLDSIMEWRKTWVQNLDSILRRGHICSSCCLFLLLLLPSLMLLLTQEGQVEGKTCAPVVFCWCLWHCCLRKGGLGWSQNLTFKEATCVHPPSGPTVKVAHALQDSLEKLNYTSLKLI